MEARPLSISYRFLLGLYAVIPLCVALQALDAAWWGGALRVSLPDEANASFWGYAAMGVPHIIASSVVMASHAEYVRAYRARLAWTVAWIGAFFALTVAVPYDASFAILGILTVAHLFHQQMGIGKGICRAPALAYSVWVWTSIVLGSLLYNHMYLSGRLPAPVRAGADTALLGLSAAFLAMTVFLHGRIGTQKGRWYLWANAAMVLGSVYFYFTSWYFLAALAPRIIHDSTAFGFYVVHDHNRDRTAPTNALHRAAGRLGYGTWWVTPAIAFTLTVLIVAWGEAGLRSVFLPVFGAIPERSLAVYLVVFLTLVHYSTEAVTWKRGSPYRAFVPVTV